MILAIHLLSLILGFRSVPDTQTIILEFGTKVEKSDAVLQKNSNSVGLYKFFYFLRELKEDVVEYRCFLRVNKKSFLISYYDSMKTKVLQYQYDGKALKLIGFIKGAGLNLAITNNDTLIYSQVTCAKMIENHE